MRNEKKNYISVEYFKRLHSYTLSNCKYCVPLFCPSYLEILIVD